MCPGNAGWPGSLARGGNQGPWRCGRAAGTGGGVAMVPGLARGRRGGSFVPLFRYSSPLSAAASFKAVAPLALASVTPS